MAGVKRERTWVYLVLVALAGLGLVGAIAAWLAIRSMGAPRVNAEPIPSPDGTKLLVTRVNRDRSRPTTYLDVEFKILDARSGRVELHRLTAASSTMRWSMRWVGSHAIQLESSDVGDRCWKQHPDGRWAATPCPP